VALHAIFKGDWLASLVMVSVPETLPAADGANCTVKVTVCDALTVAGAVRPVTVKPAPVMEIAEMCTAALPVLLRIICCVAEAPVPTFPRLTTEGAALSCPIGAVEPLPAREIFAVGIAGSLLVIEMLPVTLPDTVGRNATASVADWPLLSVFGVAIPLTEKPAPLTVITEIVRSAPPAFVTMTLALPWDETPTDPKSTVLPLSVICG
jgi:hypothetical protein